MILVGNPNVGKSLLFSALTGHYATVSNYPGTTIEITSAQASVLGEQHEIIDTPGTNGLIPQSEDESVTRAILLDSPDASVLQVGDIKNLRRTLLLTAQIAEYGIPFSLCLNMSDEAREARIEVDTDRLASALGIDVVPVSALRRWNLDRLRKSATTPRRAGFVVRYSPEIERGIVRIVALLPEMSVESRAVALSILAGDTALTPWLREHAPDADFQRFDQIREEVQASISDPLSYAISRARLTAVDAIVADVQRSEKNEGGGFRQWLGRISMHPIWGVPVLGLVLLFAWWFVGKLGAGDLVDLVENTLFNRFLNPWVIRLFDAIAPFPHVHAIEEGILTPAWTATGTIVGLGSVAKFVHDLIVGPFGIMTMALTYAIAIVLPVVTTFFIFFGILEDSGYLPRLAVMLDRVFKAMGLNGKAVLPMVLGLGCDTMATLTTRILETKKEALIVTLLLALGVPCSAQLGVIIAMLGPLSILASVIWLGVITGTIFLVGWLSSLLIKGEPADFVLEVPPMRIPKMSNILIKVLARAEWYLKEAVPLFVVGTLLLYVLDATNLLIHFQTAISPLITGLLGLPAEASNAFLIGFLRRDYGAAGLFMMQRNGQLDPIQTVVSLTVITLFIPCIANLLMMIKERGMRAGMAMTGFIIVYSFSIGFALDRILRAFEVNLVG